MFKLNGLLDVLYLIYIIFFTLLERGWDNTTTTTTTVPESGHKFLLLHEEIEQQFAGIAVCLLDVLEVLPLLDGVEDLLGVGTPHISAWRWRNSTKRSNFIPA